jgi:hypothetical protein
MAFTDKRRTFARLLPPLLRLASGKCACSGSVNQVAEREGFDYRRLAQVPMNTTLGT